MANGLSGFQGALGAAFTGEQMNAGLQSQLIDNQMKKQQMGLRQQEAQKNQYILGQMASQEKYTQDMAKQMNTPYMQELQKESMGAQGDQAELKIAQNDYLTALKTGDNTDKQAALKNINDLRKGLLDTAEKISNIRKNQIEVSGGQAAAWAANPDPANLAIVQAAAQVAGIPPFQSNPKDNPQQTLQKQV